MVLPVQQWALVPLEDRFPRPLPPAHVDAIIVLGGALETFISEERGLPSLNAAAERMTEFVALARRYPEARLVFSGGSGAVLPGAESESEIARDLFDQLGISPNRIVFEGRSRNTHENVVFSQELARPKPGEVWLLVTSAIQMPRAVGVFRQVGWPVIPWPVGYKSVHSVLVSVSAPLGERLSVLDDALHEWVGLATYRAAGWSAELFPGP